MSDMMDKREAGDRGDSIQIESGEVVHFGEAEVGEAKRVSNQMPSLDISDLPMPAEFRRLAKLCGLSRAPIPLPRSTGYGYVGHPAEDWRIKLKE